MIETKKTEFSQENLNKSIKNIELLDKLDYLRNMTQGFPNKEDNPFKWNRWLGFVQGALWALDIMTVEELKKSNKAGLSDALSLAYDKIMERMKKLL